MLKVQVNRLSGTRWRAGIVKLTYDALECPVHGGRRRSITQHG